MEVTVPPGVYAGELIEIDGPDGNLLSTTVPEGLGPGDTFIVDHSDGSATAVGAASANRSDIMLAFSTWFERESVGDRVDRFVKTNAHRMAATGSLETSATGGEHSLEWWPVYLEYQAEFEALLQEFLDEGKAHGWPSFRDEEVVWESVRVLPDGETVSTAGTHLGHNIPDQRGNRYCINLCSVAHQPPVRMTERSVRDALRTLS